MQPPEPQGYPPPDPTHPAPPAYQPSPPPHGYPYHPPPPTNSKAVAAMVVSLASLFTCGLLGVVGIYLGNNARAEIRSSGEQGDGMAQAGVIVGWIGVGLGVLYLCFFLVFFGIGFSPLIFASLA